MIGAIAKYLTGRGVGKAVTNFSKGSLARRALYGGGGAAIFEGRAQIGEARQDALKAYYGEEEYTNRFGDAGDSYIAGNRIMAAGIGILAGGFGIGPADVSATALRFLRGGARFGASVTGKAVGAATYGARAIAAQRRLRGARRGVESTNRLALAGAFKDPRGPIADAAGAVSIARVRANVVRSTKPNLDSIAGIGNFAAKGGMYAAAPMYAGYHVGSTTPPGSSMPGEGYITSLTRGSTVGKLNFSTAGLTQALHNNRRMR